MGEDFEDPGELIPGWNDYLLSEANRIQASLGEHVVEGKSQAGYFLGEADRIRQAACHEVGDANGRLWVVSRVLQSGHVTRKQLQDLWLRAQGDKDELIQILNRLDSLGELEG